MSNRMLFRFDYGFPDYMLESVLDQEDIFFYRVLISDTKCVLLISPPLEDADSFHDRAEEIERVFYEEV